MAIEETFSFFKQKALEGTENADEPIPTGQLENPTILQDFVDQIRSAGLTIAEFGLTSFERPLIEEHYSHHEGKPFYEGLVDWNSDTPVIAMKITGENAIEITRDVAMNVRRKNGRSNYANPNIAHSSDPLTPGDAENEIKRFAPVFENIENARQQQIRNIVFGGK